MHHSFVVEGFSFRLRPITNDDAAFVIELRGNPVLNRYLHVGANTIKEQLNWLERYYDREGDYYFVIERCKDNFQEGLISLYNIDSWTKSGEWGRWVLKTGSLAAVESAYLIYHTAFDLIGLNSVYCRTVAENRGVVSFHDSCGIQSRRLLIRFFNLNGICYDAIEHYIERNTWINIKSFLERIAKQIARKLSYDITI